MEMVVNIDAGFAINIKSVAALIRNRDNSAHTDIILVSGNRFIALHPLSEMVELLKEAPEKEASELKDESN